MLFSEFRDGNVPAGIEQLRVLKESLRLLPSGVRTVRVRSDSAGYQHDFLEFMEKGTERFGKIEFSVSCDVSKSFRQAVLEIPEEQWKSIVYTDEDGYQVTSKTSGCEASMICGSGTKEPGSETSCRNGGKEQENRSSILSFFIPYCCFKG